ncbi:hypothetical protein Bbelb_272590 [Branchiostoma belcheri]|nr:hypothetical protein Bbelb_272590 [Branchiostoma belcheri]
MALPQSWADVVKGRGKSGPEDYEMDEEEMELALNSGEDQDQTNKQPEEKLEKAPKVPKPKSKGRCDRKKPGAFQRQRHMEERMKRERDEEQTGFEERRKRIREDELKIELLDSSTDSASEGEDDND